MRVSNIPVMVGPNPVRLPERADPTAIPNTGQLYTNDYSGYTELMYQNDRGSELRLTLSDATGVYLNGAAAGFGAAAAGRVVYTAADGTLTTESALAYSASTNTLTVGSVQLGGFAALLTADAANVLAQRNGTNAQEWRIYNTFTSSSNQEHFTISWTAHAANYIALGAKTTGGSARQLVVHYGGTTARAILIGTGVGSSDVGAGVGLGAGTLSAAGARVVIAGSGVTTTATSGTCNDLLVNPTLQDGGTNSTTVVNSLTLAPVINYTGATRTGRVAALYIAPTNTSLPTGNNGAIVLSSAAADGLKGIQLYNTSDETTNYERALIRFSSNTLRIETEKGGSGTIRNMTFAVGSYAWNIAAGDGALYPTGGATLGNSGAYVSSAYITTLTMSSGSIVTDTTTGLKIGTATSQKIGFFNATPIIRPSAIADADGTLADITTKFNSLKNDVLEALGLMAA